jgi:hypothetical protein
MIKKAKKSHVRVPLRVRSALIILSDPYNHMTIYTVLRVIQKQIT